MRRRTDVQKNRLGILILATVVPGCAQGPMQHLPDLITIIGQVTVEGGGPPPVNANVEAGCTGGNHWSGYTGKDGKFTFSAAVPWHDPFVVCNIVATAPGFRTARLRIAVPDNRLAVLTLHRSDPDEGTTVSLISLNAPGAARKELVKGNAALAGRRWRQAAGSFQGGRRGLPAIRGGVVQSRHRAPGTERNGRGARSLAEGNRGRSEICEALSRMGGPRG